MCAGNRYNGGVVFSDDVVEKQQLPNRVANCHTTCIMDFVELIRRLIDDRI
jgi:hypothetical protein